MEMKYVNTISELKILYPDLEQIAYSKSLKSTAFETDTTLYSSLPAFYLKWSNRTRSYTRKTNEGKIYDFLKSRLMLDTLLILNF